MLVVITGGPYSGKTTLVNAMGERGYRTVPEAAIDVIAELNQELGVEEQKVWRKENRREFQTRILARQVQFEKQARAEKAGPTDVVFLDRGRLDGVAYSRYFDQPVSDEYLRLASEVHYDRVFLLDTLSDFHLRADSGRTSDRATSLALAKVIGAVYAEHGLEPVFVPEMTLQERVALVMGELGLE